MKTTLITLLTATLLGTASVASGRPFDAADFIAVAFTAGLVAWTVAQYCTEPRTLISGQCLNLPIKTNFARTTRSAAHCAA